MLFNIYTYSYAIIMLRIPFAKYLRVISRKLIILPTIRDLYEALDLDMCFIDNGVSRG